LLSDSFSSLIALGGSHVDQDTIYKYLKTYSTLTNSGITVILCSIPDHVGIPGNERVDRVAKAALSLPTVYLLSRYQPWTSSHAPNWWSSQALGGIMPGGGGVGGVRPDERALKQRTG